MGALCAASLDVHLHGRTSAWSLVTLLAGCSSSEGSSNSMMGGQDSSPGDTSRDSTTRDSSSPDAEITLDATADVLADQARLDDASPSDGGSSCAVDGAFPGAPTPCEYKACPAGCACIEEGTPRNVACMCADAANPGAASICFPPASTTCGTVLCEPPLVCNQAGVGCATPEGGDASALDGGPLCSNDGTAFPGAPGTCSGQSCSPGCACVATTTGGVCVCPSVQASGAGPLCVAPSCGTIFCESGCTCTDAASGSCQCQTEPDGGTDPSGRPCASSADCGGGLFGCLYPLAGGCSATSVCMPINASAGACVAVALCGCDGTNFSDTFCDKAGTDKPVAHTGFCEAGSD